MVGQPKYETTLEEKGYIHFVANNDHKVKSN